MISLTYDGTTMRLYADGVQIGTITVAGSIVTGNGYGYIGNNPLNGSPNPNYVDEAGVWSRALSASEITQL